jgi:hypothetical protein
VLADNFFESKMSPCNVADKMNVAVEKHSPDLDVRQDLANILKACQDPLNILKVRQDSANILKVRQDSRIIHAAVTECCFFLHVFDKKLTIIKMCPEQLSLLNENTSHGHDHLLRGSDRETILIFPQAHCVAVCPESIVVGHSHFEHHGSGTKEPHLFAVLQNNNASWRQNPF